MAVATRTDEITGLITEEENFCRGMVSGMRQIEAWRQAFPLSKSADKSAHVTACRLAQTPRILARMAALRAELREYTGITLREHVDTLAALRDGAVGAGQYGPAVTAEANRGKVSGLYVERVDHTGNVSIFASRQDEDL